MAGETGRGIKDDLRRARELSWSNLGRSVVFYAPSFAYYKGLGAPRSPLDFPSISVTGRSCALNCDHCGGRLLRTMIPAQTPEELIKACEAIEAGGGAGCLISGGCSPSGAVPLRRFAKAIKEIKRRGKLKLVVHTGLIDRETAKELGEAGIDAALIDVVGSEETLREIYHLNASLKDFDNSLRFLREAGIPVVPHVLIGVHHGRIKGEYDALKLIARHDPAALILIVFFPVKGTRMEGDEPPGLLEVAKFMVDARMALPRKPIALGCARPKGAYRAALDSLAIEAGVNAVAFPTKEAVELAKALGLKISYSRVCCSQIYEGIVG